MAEDESSLKGRAQLRSGSTLCGGRYIVERLIGVGGMASVYAGTHRNGHRVAIKVLHDRLSREADFERRFRREAHLVNTIHHHPGVVSILDDDTSEDGRIFLVMPLLEGETLHMRRIRFGGCLNVDEAVQIACAVLDVLAVAHDAGIVHCDIKPDNVFLTSAGDIKSSISGSPGSFPPPNHPGRHERVSELERPRSWHRSKRKVAFTSSMPAQIFGP